ncbi:DUF748 domain-containing protein [Imbroritus primus]|uniref:DUF748 domain-containing protein n=1 Tax=Imbroritus primus TaxID=3058603 RepID=A0ACD3SKM7_9BURK|nr:DUF748 domain-containing protein [Burkholderiaceae bacterium PBA]
MTPTASGRWLIARIGTLPDISCHSMPKIALPNIPVKHKRRILTTGKVLLATAVVLSVAAWLGGPPLIRSVVTDKLSTQLGRKVTFGEVNVNPLRLAARIHDIAIYEPDQKAKMVSVGELAVNLSFTSLLRLAPVLDELTVDQPVVNVAYLGDDRFSFSDIVDRLAAEPKDPAAKPARFSLNNIRVMRGEFRYDDRVHQSQHTVTDLNVALPFLSNLPYAADIYTEPSFRANIDGSPIFVDGEVLPFASSHKASIQVNLDGLQLPRFMPFVATTMRGKVESGLLDTRLHVQFEQKESKQSVVVSGTAGVRDMKLVDGARAPVLQWRALQVTLDDSEPLSQRVGIHEVKLDAPEIWVDRAADGTLNLQRLFVSPAAPAASAGQVKPVAMPASGTPVVQAQPAQSSPSAQASKPAAPAAAPQAKAEARIFDLDKLLVQGGTVHVRDAGFRGANGQPATVDLNDVAISVAQFSTAGDTPAPLSVAATIQDGGRVKTNGTLRFAGQAVEGKLALEAIKPHRFAPFYASAFAGQLGDTEIHGDLNYRVAWPASGVQAVLSDSSASLRNLQVTLPKAKTPAISAREIDLSGVEFDLAKQTVALAGVAIDGAKVAATRAANGDIDLAALGGSGASSPASAAKAPSRATAPWRVALGKLTLAGSEVVWEDKAVAAANGGKPASLKWRNLKGQVENIQYPFVRGEQGRWPMTLAFSDARKGTASVSGQLAPEPFAADLKLDLRALDIAAFQPYAAEYSNAVIAGGALTAAGRLVTRTEPGKAARTSYTGNLRLANLRAVDKVSGDSFLRWRALDVSRIDAQLNTRQNPVDITLGDVSLADFYARVILNADGRLNLADIRARPEAGTVGKSLTEASAVPAPNVQTGNQTATAPVPTTPKDGPPPMVRVGRVSLQKGNINFSDFFVKPNYTTNLTGLEGTISRVASDDPKPADVSIKGRVDGDAPISITGQVNPFSTQLFLDLQAQAKGIELTRLTPYAAKYAGYPITKGKLNVDVTYHIENGQLQASNKLFLDQLTFGERVDSPDATKLPVLLAVALLKNSRGEIDVNLPVSGSLSDPQFSVGGVIIRVIINLLTKAITSPFSLIASAFGDGGGGEGLGYIEFDPGTSRLTDAQEKKLGTIAKALTDRPALKLEIIGRVDPDTDRDGAKREYMMRRVRAQKRQDLVSQGGGANPEEVEVQPQEYAKYLERAYKNESFKKPRNMIGLTKSLPVAEMEKLMMENAPVGEAELKALAERRASAVKRYLEEEGKVPNERLFLVTPKLNADGITDKGKPSRVDFAVQL